jgi:hypothetical protein
METVLKWYNLMFYIPLAMAILSALGAGFEHDIHGDADIHGDIHADGDQDADQDSEHTGLGMRFLGFLGFGKVPLAISLMTLLLLYAGTGLMCNTILKPAIDLFSGFALISVAVAVFVTFFGTAFVSRTIGRLLPTTETNSVKKNDLVGCSGKIILDCNQVGIAIAQIKNRSGGLYQIQCKSDIKLDFGMKILTIDYDSTSDFFTVVQDPTG